MPFLLQYPQCVLKMNLNNSELIVILKPGWLDKNIWVLYLTNEV